jgi:hypothetical protein
VNTVWADWGDRAVTGGTPLAQESRASWLDPLSPGIECHTGALRCSKCSMSTSAQALLLLV